MLRELRLGNLALARDLVLELGAGLTMLTGETGAGKSLIAGAMALLAGGKAERGLIREGEEMAWVEGVFDLADRPEDARYCQRLGIRLGGDDVLVLRRELKREGRGRVVINGLTSSVVLLEDVGSRLLSIQSQDQQRVLGRSAFAGEFLDGMLELSDDLAEMATALDAHGDCVRQLDDRRQEVDLARQQLEIWQYQYRELNDAGLDPAEEAQLAERLSVGRNARGLLEAAGTARQHLTESTANARELLGSAEAALAPLETASTKLGEILEQIRDAQSLTAEAASNLERFLDVLEVDPASLDELEERKALYEDLGREYARDVDGMLEMLELLAERISRQESADDDILVLDEAVTEAADRVANVATALRSKRLAGAVRVAEDALACIRPLALPELDLEFRILPDLDERGPVQVAGHRCRISRRGADRIALNVRTNRGEAMGEVGNVASGGERSRIYLGLSVLAGTRQRQPLLLFDEIDSGLGMDNAVPVASLLQRLAQRTQVLCITHLPTVAARGRTHLQVSKQAIEGRTVVSVSPLDGESRLAEIARLLGGEKSGAAAGDSQTAYARQLLEAGESA